MAGRKRSTMELLEQFKQRTPLYENMPDKYIDGIDYNLNLLRGYL